jgi:hypothetical protein
MKTSKLLLVAVIVALLAIFFIFDLQSFFTLDALKSQQTRMESYRSAHPVLAVTIYGLIYVAVAGLVVARRRCTYFGGRRDIRVALGDINRLVRFFRRRDVGVSGPDRVKTTWYNLGVP